LEFVLESAKSDWEPEDIGTNLEEVNVSESLASILIEGFREHKARIRARLKKIGHSFPQVTGMNWRLDYTLRSSTGGKVMLPNYVISLNTIDGTGEDKTVQFTCNREQLKDFLRKVEDAETQVERAIGSTK
jgi:lambda repressor-like predicted transcriptional regulator